MRKSIIVLLCCGFVLATSVMAAPVYVKTWDFEDGTVGQPHPDWSGGVVLTNAPYGGTPYTPVPNQRLHTGDNTAAWTTLPAATNSFVYTGQIRWDAGQINGFRKAGLGYKYAGTTHEVWFEGDDRQAWNKAPSDRLRFGDSWLPNPRPGTPDVWANYQWQGGGGRVLDRSTVNGIDNLGGYYTLQSPSWELPMIGHGELMIKYNTPDNPGTVELYFRSIDYDNVRTAAGNWLKLGWGGDGGVTYWDFILPINPATNDYWEIDQIKLGGAYAWSQCSFDNVVFQSIPEPVSLVLIGLAAIPMLRRRR
ncbi:MAG: hypothetical protein ACUVXJ_20205 [Phycisphaerae bacterium]